MTSEDLRQMGLERELNFSASRSSGPGGQNVNKVNTKIELRFNVGASSILSLAQKEIIILRLKNRISSDGELIIVSQAGRSQLENRTKAVEKFFFLLAQALTPAKKRIATRPTRGSKEIRLKKKKILSELKRLRRSKGFSGPEQD